MKTLISWLLCCVVCLAVAGPVGAEPLGSFESPVELSTPNQIDPRQTDRLMVYRTLAGADGDDLWGFDVATGIEFPIATGPGHQWGHDVAGDLVVWNDRQDDPSAQSIWGMKLVLPATESPSGPVTSQPFLLTDTPGGFFWDNVAVSGDFIVWSDRRRGYVWDETTEAYRQVDDIYGRRLSTGQELLIYESAAGRAATAIATDGRWVAWIEYPFGSEGGDLMVHDLRSGDTIAVYAGALVFEPCNVSQGLVAFHAGAGSGLPAAPSFWVYDAVGQALSLVSSDPGEHRRGTLDGSHVVWRYCSPSAAYVLRSAVITTGAAAQAEVRSLSGEIVAPTALDPDNPNLRAGRLAWDDRTASALTRRLWALVRFSDVPLRHWAYWHIEQCARAGVVQGYPEGDYRPAEAVTRAQMAVYLSRALLAGAAPPSPPLLPCFADVDTEFWAYPHIEYCASQGIVQGYPEGDYRPQETVDRAQMAVYVSRSLVGGNDGVPAPPQSPSFTDVDTDFWAYPYIEHCVARGVVRGYPEGDYRPAETVSRDQMAVYVGRAFLPRR